MTTEERIITLDRKLMELDVYTLKADELLKIVHAHFPLPGSGMPEDFKGSHSITLKDNKLFVNVWCDGRCWQCYYAF